MHQSLRLGCTGVEYAACVPEDFQDVGVVWGFVVPPAYEACIMAEIFHPDHLFDTDWKPVKASNNFAMFGVVVVEEFGSGYGSFWEEFGDAIGLAL